MKVIIVDGPIRGQLRGVDDQRFVVFERGVNIFGPMKEVTYHVHRISLFGVHVNIASIQYDQAEIKGYDIFEYVASNMAKEARML